MYKARTLAAIFIVLQLVIYAVADSQVIGNPVAFTVENRTYGGISIPQRTEQPALRGAKYALAGTGWSAGTTFYLRSSIVDGGLIVTGTYGEYNAEKRLAGTRLHLLRVEIGAFTDFYLIGYDGKMLVFGSFGKAFVYSALQNNGFGGSVGTAYEAGKRYGVFGKWSYYDLGTNTIALLEAGIQVTGLLTNDSARAEVRDPNANRDPLAFASVDVGVGHR